MFLQVSCITLSALLICQSLARAEDAMLTAVVAGLETLSESYSQGEIEFQSAVPPRAAHDVNYTICSGTYRWKNERVLVQYYEWKSDSQDYQQLQQVPSQAKRRVYVANKERSYLWYPDQAALFVAEKITQVRMPRGIEVGPHTFWLTLDGQFALHELLSKDIPLPSRRWVIDDSGEEVRIGMGSVDEYYEFSFHVGDHVLPTGYEIKGTKLPKIVMRGEVKWHANQSPPSVAELKFFRGSSLDNIKVPWLAFSCSPISLPNGPDSDFDFEIASVPDGTLVNHRRRPGVPARVYRKGNVTEVEGTTEKMLRELAEEIRGK